MLPGARLALRFVDRYIRREGWAPNYREIMEGTGIKSISGVAYALRELVERGLIKHKKGDARAICLTDDGRAYLEHEYVA